MSALALVAAQPARRRVSLVVTGGTVITQNAAHRQLAPGAVAIDGPDIVDVDTPAAIAAKYQRDRHDRRARSDRPARADQHAHSRADGDVSRARRRPGVDGLAAEIHLSGRGQDRVTGAGSRRHAPGSCRDDRVGDDGVRRHVLLRGRDREGDGRGRAARRARRNHHPVSGRGREDSGRRARPRGALHQGVQGQRPGGAGGGAPRALHQRQGDLDRVGGVGAQVRRADRDPFRGDRGRGSRRARAVSDDADRRARIARRSRTDDDRRARRVGRRRGHRDSQADRRPASRTTRRAT